MYDELTEVDIKKMQEEIDYRTRELTPKFKAELQAARELGDLSENDEYRSAKRELNRNYSRIRYLKQMIDTAVVIKVDKKDDVIGLFDKVTFNYEGEDDDETVTIVTTLRSDVLNGYVSKESPLGKALIGHKGGDRVKVEVNETNHYFVVIKSFEKGHDDESIDISSF